MLFEETELDIELLRSRFKELESLCNKLETLKGNTEDSKQELGLTLLHLERLFRKIEVNTRYSRVGATFNRLGITPEDLYVLSFGDLKELLKKTHSGNKDRIKRLISTIRNSTSFWEKRVFSKLSKIPEITRSLPE